MRLNVLPPSTNDIEPDVLKMLWHYARGEFPTCATESFWPIAWRKFTHRGVQLLDSIRFPRKQRRYVFSEHFEFRIDHAFAQVVRFCAENPRDDGQTWLTPELREGYLRLYRAGYAHSFEAWQHDRLVGGALGVQIGGYISVESMFRHVPNASKAAYGRALLHLRDRGFEWVDVNFVCQHMVNYGEQWVPQWQFERELRRLLRQRPTITDDTPPAPLPLPLRIGLPALRAAEGVGRRLKQVGSALQRAAAQVPRVARSGR